jgi:hypothetical protein
MVRESNGRFSLEQSTKQLVGAFRGIEAYEPATNSWTTLPSMPMPRHGAVIGNRFHLVSGDGPVRRDDGVPRPASPYPTRRRTTLLQDETTCAGGR